MSSRENSLVERIKSASDDALNRGWQITKEAIDSADLQRQRELTQQAELIYRSPSSEIANVVLFQNPSEELLSFLTIKFLETEINVFDLYRRVGRIDEARELGEVVFGRSVATGDIALVNRCGNFLNLTMDAEARVYSSGGDFERAYKTFSVIEETFDLMKMENSSGKDLVMLYSNRAANLLSMIDISMNKRVFAEDVDRNLSSAEKYNLKSKDSIDNSDLKDEDKSIWMANFYYNLGLICRFRGNLEGAIHEYRNALSVSKEDSGYTQLVMGLYVNLSDALVSTQNPIHIDEVKSNYKLIEEFIFEGGGFGIYSPAINLMIDRIRSSLE